MTRIKPRSLALLAATPLLLLAACNKEAPPPQEQTSTPARSPAIVVTEVKVGKAVTSDNHVTEALAVLGRRDTLYVAVTTDGAGEGVPIVATWTGPDGSLVQADTVRVTATGPETTEFHVSRARAWPAGKYKVEVQLGNSPSRAVEFDIR